MSAKTPLAAVVEDRPRVGRVHRTTKESDVEVVLDLDGTGICEVSTGLPFFDHMLSQLGRHGGFDLLVKATGDLELGDERSPLGTPGFDPQLAEEFFRAFVMEAALTLHLALRYGKNTHHILEASFKGTARALRAAVRVESTSLPSTK